MISRMATDIASEFHTAVIALRDLIAAASWEDAANKVLECNALYAGIPASTRTGSEEIRFDKSTLDQLATQIRQRRSSALGIQRQRIKYARTTGT